MHNPTRAGQIRQGGWLSIASINRLLLKAVVALACLIKGRLSWKQDSYFVDIDMGCEAVPDATTLLKFRRLLEKHQLGERLFAEVGRVLQASGMKLASGTIVDATLIAAPSSTKNRQQARDREMHQTRKGKQLYFGM
jgi:hypothetical protein